MIPVVTIPSASPLLFKDGITHPELWLWDSWLVRDASTLHLYCLALSRYGENREPILPADRNKYAFHVRHFSSSDRGQSWRDLGAALQSGQLADNSDSRNIWSGSATRFGPSDFVFSHTGLSETDSDRPFVQSINALNTKDLFSELQQQRSALICPLRDYSELRQAGYYLAPPDQIGHADGEEGGPIMALRDPYTFVAANDMIHLFFSAKIAPKKPAIGHAILSLDKSEIKLEKLLEPIMLPDADIYTQAEVPKVFHDEKRDIYYLLISACDRLYEGQIDSEVTKVHRLYKATGLSGPWTPYRTAGSLLDNMNKLFGASLIEADFDSGDFTFIAPYTEMAEPHKQLSFAPVFTVNIYQTPNEIAEKRA